MMLPGTTSATPPELVGDHKLGELQPDDLNLNLCHSWAMSLLWLPASSHHAARPDEGYLLRHQF